MTDLSHKKRRADWGAEMGWWGGTGMQESELRLMLRRAAWTMRPGLRAAVTGPAVTLSLGGTVYPLASATGEGGRSREGCCKCGRLMRGGGGGGGGLCGQKKQTLGPEATEGKLTKPVKDSPAAEAVQHGVARGGRRGPSLGSHPGTCSPPL